MSTEPFLTPYRSIGCSVASGPSQGLSLAKASAILPSTLTVEPHVPTGYLV